MLLIFTFSGCGGGSASGKRTGITGVTQKGDFLKASQISFARFSKNGASSTERLDSLILSNKGEYTVNLPWSDWTKITVTGIFYNEFLGEDSTLALTLNSITNIRDSLNGINVNVFTHLVATRIEYLVDHGSSLNIASRQALSELRSLLGLSSSNLDILDLTKNSHPDNAILLLFSSGFLATNNQRVFATSLDSLTMDFADNGLFDGTSASLFQAIANYSGKINVFSPIHNNLVARGYANPPSRSTLDGLPTWVNKNPLVSIEGSESGKTILLGETVILRGTGTDPDGQISAYLWLEGDDTKGSNDVLELDNLTVGEHFIELKVTDNKGASTSTLIKVTVNSLSNNAPTVDAGSDQTINVGSSVTINGSASDNDGSVVSWNWKTKGAIITSGSGADISPLVMNNLSIGQHLFILSVTDNIGATATDSAKVTVNAVINKFPVVNAGSDQTINFGEVVTLNGFASDEDGSITSWAWKEGGIIKKSGSGSIVSPLVIRNLSIGQHLYSLLVTDNNGATAIDIVKIIVNSSTNKAPVAHAGVDQTVTFGDSITLNGSASDEDGSIVSWNWKKGGVTIKSGNGSLISSLTISNLSLGDHLYSLTVTDNKGATSTDIVKITVIISGNKIPIANAGSNQTILFGDSVTLSGSASDLDGSIVSWSWKKDGITRKSGSGSVISSLVVNNLPIGVHQFTLVVTDNDGATAFDHVIVTVNSTNNIAPVANAGSDKTISFGDSVTLNGSASDSDGSVVSWVWKKNGITQLRGSGSTVSPLIINNLGIGVHIITLIVTDNNGASGSDNVRITVNSAANISPIANAGSDQTIDFGESTTLTGSGSDADGSIKSWSWKKGATVLKSGTGSVISSYAVTNPSIGKHEFTLEVIDNKGASGTDKVIITVVSTSGNKPPTANAGSDKTIVELQAAQLTGVGTDTDGTIASYKWKEGSVTLSSSQTLNLKVLSSGTHNLTLTVTDNEGKTGSDGVTIIVNPLSVNLNNQTICRTKFGFHLQVIYSLSGNKTGSGNSELNLYSNPGCTGTRSDPTALGFSRYAPASYVIRSVNAAGASGKMAITSQGRSSTRNITISSDGTVTAIN